MKYVNITFKVEILLTRSENMYLLKPLVCLVLLMPRCIVVLVAASASNAVGKLEFVEVPPDKNTFIRDKLRCKTSRKKNNVKVDHSLLNCEVNREANITWQACRSFNGNVMSKENFLGCDELFANEAKYCVTGASVINKRSLATSIKKLVDKIWVGSSWEPHKGCIRCIARADNESVKASGQYKYEDQCGTYSRYDAINPHKYCFRKNQPDCEKKIKKKCRVEAVHNVKIITNFTEAGRPDLVLQWEQKPTIDNYVYGYEIEVIYESIYGCSKIITKYERDKWLKKTFEDGSHLYQFSTHRYHPSIYSSLRDGKKIKFTIKSLPHSDTKKVNMKISHQDMCRSYAKMYKRAPPARCLMVRNITNEFLNQHLVMVRWNISALPRNVSEIHVWHFPLKGGRNNYENLKGNATFVNFANASVGDYILIKLKVGSVYTYQSKSYKLTRHTITTVAPTLRPTANSQELILYICFSVITLAFVILASVYRREITIICLNKRLKYFPQLSTTSTTSGEEEREIKVMIVYPEGCGEVEKLTIKLATILQQLRIQVLVDVLQNVDVAEEGPTNKLVKDFEVADYVVVLCIGTESLQGDEKSTSKNYNFVMQSLLLPACRELKGNTKRFIAVTLSKSQKSVHVPPYLKERSYVLSSDLEFFLQHILHGIQTTCSSNIFRNFVRNQLENIDAMKSDFSRINELIKAQTHQNCYAPDCCRGIKDIASSLLSLTEKLDEKTNSFLSLLDAPDEHLLEIPDEHFIETPHEEYNSGDKLLDELV